VTADDSLIEHLPDRAGRPLDGDRLQDRVSLAHLGRGRSCAACRINGCALAAVPLHAVAFSGYTSHRSLPRPLHVSPGAGSLSGRRRGHRGIQAAVPVAESVPISRSTSLCRVLDKLCRGCGVVSRIGGRCAAFTPESYRAGRPYFCTVLFDTFSSLAIIFCFVPAVAVAIAGDPALAHLVEPQPERAARGELLPKKRVRRALGILFAHGSPPGLGVQSNDRLSHA